MIGKNELQGKKLLLMGGSAFSQGILQYARRNNVRLIAIGNQENTPAKKISDESYNIDTHDVEAVVKLCKNKNIDGIFVGSGEFNIIPAVRVAEKADCRFYATEEQWNILSNKVSFKELASSCNIPVVPEYNLEDNIFEYPVVVKAPDSCACKGVFLCRNRDELHKYYKTAQSMTKSGRVVIEEFISNAQECFFDYTIQDGVVSLSDSFTKIQIQSDNPLSTMPILQVYPCSRTQEFQFLYQGCVEQMLSSLGIRNGAFTLQSFYSNGSFYVFESGFRMAGSQAYIFTDFFNQVNNLDFMLNYVLTGKMSDYSIKEKDNPYFEFPCCNYYVALKKGVIAQISGIDDVLAMKQVLNITQFCNIGDIIEDKNSLDRVALRIHVFDETEENLAQTLVKISNALRIIDSNGCNMQLEALEYQRCLEAIKSR